MAGSYKHVTRRINGETQFVGCALLENMGDAFEALEELWFMVRFLGGDSDELIQAAHKEYYAQTSPLSVSIMDRIKKARDSGHWEGRLNEVAE